MCGILAIFNSQLPEAELRSKLIQCAQRLRHRGPDWSGYRIVGNGKHGIAHERLAIIDPESGAQPLTSHDGTVMLAVNGEIYNFKELYQNLHKSYTPKTGSDCEAIIPLYEQRGMDFINDLRGMFAFVIYDAKTGAFFAVRDHVGIVPLYIGWGDDGSVWIASEMKALAVECRRFRPFPPAHYWSSTTKEFTRWYNPGWRTLTGMPTQPCDLTALRNAFTKAVVRRMMSDVPWGVLLSGGLDSSLVASVASRHARRNPNSPFPRIHSFSVGIEGSPDLKAAKEVADFLGTVHHSYQYTIQEGLDAIREVVYHLETYDTTTIRASTPMFLMSRKIKAMGVKMVLSGEGADEIFGGYLYFHKAPNAQEFFEETRDKVQALHQFDCLRANKSTSAWGVEPRVPFLDADFLELSMNIDPSEKMIHKAEGRMEKYIIRKAFDTPDDPYLPDHILWRQKEQFSDGVGYGWIDALRDNAAAHVSDDMFNHRANRFPHNPPASKEAYLYRSIFEEFYPTQAAAETVPGGPSIACSTARAIEWDESFKGRADCSGRSVGGVHNMAYDETFKTLKE
ncbi:asparagine synthase [Tribonema minus]|uniref:asparagine synthase (glutamine-hydrolyzing) n=1 Tax=Tribonema minus TaxID=303371 RepID=A0A835Z2W5_9STRA|nr:asparagine synthase [Tribonema minus]